MFSEQKLFQAGQKSNKVLVQKIFLLKQPYGFEYEKTVYIY